MARYIPLQDKLDEIEEQGGRLRRRLDYLKGERDFLVDTLLTRPVKDMEAQRRLLREWDEEIEKLELQRLTEKLDGNIELAIKQLAESKRSK